MSNRDGDEQIYVMDMDGSRVSRLTNGPGVSFGPAFNPEGTNIAFTSYRDGTPQVYVMNADGMHVFV
jgi:Tol biopolymer transport system component